MGKTFLKSWPTSLRWLLQPALFVSLGLHLLLLVAPLPERDSPSEPVALDLEEVPVRVSPRSELPPPSLTPTPQPRVATPQPSPTPMLPVQRPAAVARPAVVPSAVRPPVQSPPVASSPSARPSPSPSPAALATPAIPSPAPVPPLALPFADMPVLTGAETGCYGLGTCYQLTGGMDFRTAGQTLEKQLQAQGYTVRFRDDLEVAGAKTYEISKDGETRYLNVLSADLNNAVYLVTPQPISLVDLQNSDQPKAELETVLNSLPATTANATQFAEPEAFFAGATPRLETDGNLRLIANPPEQVLQTLASQLQTQGFVLTEAGGYGAGLLYEVTKGALTAYLNLVPTFDQTGTIVVLWSSLPG